MRVAPSLFAACLTNEAPDNRGWSSTPHGVRMAHMPGRRLFAAGRRKWAYQAQAHEERWMKRRAIMWVLGIAAFPAVLSSSCSPSGYSGPTESVTLGIRASEVASLVYVAENQGYLSANGINLVLKEYDSGVGSADALINGEVAPGRLRRVCRRRTGPAGTTHPGHRCY